MAVRAFFIVVVLGLASGSVAFIVARARIFREIRAWIYTKSEWLGDGFSCPLCVGVWLCLVATAIYRPRILELWYPLDLLVSAFVMVAISVWTSGLIFRSISNPYD